MENTQRFTNTSTKQQWIAEQARAHPERVFTALHHLIDIDWMREAYRRTRKDGAAGVDGVTAADYEEDLNSNLADLLNRIKSGRYVAPAVRRHWIPKGDGTSRPLGIPTFEDKVAQRAILMIIEPIYEQDFKSCSYGFRPGKGCHDALDAIYSGIMEGRNRWVIDADLENYFGSIRHDTLRSFLDLRIKDGVIRRMIDKWLKAGILDKGVLTRSKIGTPQGGVLSPCLSNIFLHYVLDKWFEQEVKPRLCGNCRLIRYADDFVILFEYENDARRVLEVLDKRLGKYGLLLHKTKTRFIDFRPPRDQGTSRRASFDFLGFTHVWGESWRGKRYVQRLTSKARFARAVKSVHQWCKMNRHRPLAEQHARLSRIIAGHCAYYGITGNSRRLSAFRFRVCQCWHKALSRRSRKGKPNWERMNVILSRFPLPLTRVSRPLHAY